MATLEQFMAEANNAYQPAKNAIQTQLGSLEGNYNTSVDTINRNYAQQQSQLENQRNQAAESATLAAAGNGGSFGGQAEISNRKYYEQSFVPAQTQLQTNQTNELAKAKQDYDNQRTSLNAQLSNLDATANQLALQQYWAAVEAEKQRQAQLAAAQVSNPYQYLPDGYGSSSQGNSNQNARKMWDFGNGYAAYAGDNGEAVYTYNGAEINRGDFLSGTGGNRTRWDLWNDIWNNGIRTNGIGSDTVEAFKNGISPTMQNLKKYGYLSS